MSHILQTDRLVLRPFTLDDADAVFHIHCDPHEDYRNWLRLTPWTSRSPLPVGPIQLLPQDALWLGVALLLWHDPGVSRLYLPLCFLTGYLAVVCASCLATGEQGVGWILAFGLGEMVRQWYSPLTAIAIGGWLYLAGWVGVRRLLARFPWTLTWIWEMRSLQAVVEEQKQRMLGWPLDQLQVRRDEQQVSYRERVLLSVLIGWWVYCLQSLITMPQLGLMFLLMVLTFMTLAAIFARTVGYWLDYRPPIGFWGRLRTFRWIIPRYDHILVTPALIFFVACCMPAILNGWQMPMEVALTATVSLVLLLSMVMPPSFEQWRLTGYHRIVPGSINKQEFEKI